MSVDSASPLVGSLDVFIDVNVSRCRGDGSRSLSRLVGRSDGRWSRVPGGRIVEDGLIPSSIELAFPGVAKNLDSVENFLLRLVSYEAEVDQFPDHFTYLFA